MPADDLLSLPQLKLLWMLFVVFCFAGAVNISEVHARHGLLGGFIYSAVLATSSYWLLFRKHGRALRTLLGTLGVWLAVLAALGVLDQRHNVKVDLAGAPMTTSLALEYPARALLLRGHEMYSVTAAGAPISPGPGWILFWSPLTVPGETGYLCAIALAVLTWLIYRRNPIAAGLFTCLMLLQPLFLSQMANGQDLFAISFALAALALLLEEFKADWQIALLGVLGGVIATSRVPIIAFVGLLGVGLWKRNHRAGILFALISVTIGAGFHAEGAYFAHRAGHFYQPMHVLSRAASGGVSRVKALLLLVLGATAVLWRIRGNAISWLICLFTAMALLFTPEGIGEYFNVHRWDWEGANYISFPIPLLLLGLVLASPAAKAQRAT